MVTTSANVVTIHHNVNKNLQDTPTPINHKVLESIKVNIFLRPEEAMFENWQKLVFH